MKRILALLLLLAMAFLFSGCAPEKPELDLSQMKSICNLATLKCYYHNIAKYKEADAEKFLMFSKDKHFWIEYAGTVEFGIDAANLSMDVSDDIVTITLPPAEVLNCTVDENTLNDASIIVAKGSAAITAEDQTAAFAQAQSAMKEAASGNTSLLSNAQERARKLLRDYVKSISDASGTNYRIIWKTASAA